MDRKFPELVNHKLSDLERSLRRGCRPYRMLLNTRYYLDRDWLRNPQSRRYWQAQSAAHSKLQHRILTEIRERGIALAHVDELIEDAGLRGEVSGIVEEFARSDRVKAKIEQCGGSDRLAVTKDDYVVRLVPKDAAISCCHPLLRFAIHPGLLDLVNDYLEMWSKLNYTDVWYTIQQQAAQTRVRSQRWHRDPEDERMLKVFLYASDMDERAGPLEYIVGSFARGPSGDVWRKPGGLGQSYIGEEEVDERFPPSGRFTATGRAGTVVFCDTSGLHRGGLATGKPRVFATWCFVTPASLAKRRFKVRFEGTSPQLTVLLASR